MDRAMEGEDGAVEDILIDGSNVGQFLMRLEQVKAEIIDEVRIRTDAARNEAENLKNEVIEKLGSISTGLERVVTCVTSSARTSRSRSQGSRSRENKKRAIPDAEDIPYLNTVADKDRCVLPLLRCTIVLSTLSFIQAFPSANSWVSETTKENMAHCSRLLPGVSGFSLVFFSVPADEPKARFKGRMGKLWSFLCTNTIVAMLMSSRVQNFDFEDPVTGKKTETGHVAPSWLQSFGGVNRATRIVSEVVESLELTGVVPMSRSAKKPRVQGEQFQTDVDEDRGAREQAVRVMRSGLLRTMSSGRTEARMHLFKSFLFLVDKINTFDTVEEAAEEGFEFVFRDSVSGVENKVPNDISGSIWDVPRTETNGSNETELNKSNMKLLEDLAAHFPSLSIRLKYKKLVKRRTQDTDDGFPEFFEDILHCAVTEDLSLHRVAMGVLVEMFTARNFLSVLSSSTLALRTVHIFAIALRGIVKKGLGKDLTELERVAMGDVTFKLLQRGEELATVMVGNRNEKPKEGDEKSTLDKEREKKFEMTWAQYKAEKSVQEAEARAEEENTRSAVGQTQDENSGTARDTFKVGWMAE